MQTSHHQPGSPDVTSSEVQGSTRIDVIESDLIQYAALFEQASEQSPVAVGAGFVALDVIHGEPLGSGFQRRAGGTCGNVLTILGYLGWSAYPVARLNGDDAARRIRSDFTRWGVKLSYTASSEPAHTPIVVEQIVRNSGEKLRHKYAWRCPCCDAMLPRFRPIRATDALSLAANVAALKPAVFFLDRLSRGSLVLAEACAQAGAAVVFEPSSVVDNGLLRPALELADIVKYSRDRISELPQYDGVGPILEVQTLGDEGLQYRWRDPNGTREFDEWTRSPAIKLSSVVDAAGSGDWSTAGILHALCQRGVAGLKSATEPAVARALRLGQALAAWNCGFAGARGGMYQVTRHEFRDAINRIIHTGESEARSITWVPDEVAWSLARICPSCQVDEGVRGQSTTLP